MKIFAVLCLLGLAFPASVLAQTSNPYADLFSLDESEALKRGRADALKDAQSGNYKILTYGLRRGPSEKEKALEKLGIKTTDIAGCIVSAGILGYAKGYNAAMKPILEKKFGPEIFGPR